MSQCCFGVEARSDGSIVVVGLAIQWLAPSRREYHDPPAPPGATTALPRHSRSRR